MSHRSNWKFNVKGSLSDGDGGPPLRAYEAIVEPGVRLDTSPHNLKGIGPIARPNGQGLFGTYFVTFGADRPIEPPESIKIFVRIGKGDWKPYIVSIDGRKPELLSQSEMMIDLGAFAIEPNQPLYIDEN